MDTYRFDFKEVIHGSLEIEAEHGIEAEQKFMDMSLRDLLKYSNHASDGTERKIRFVTAPSEYGLESEEWDNLKGYL